MGELDTFFTDLPDEFIVAELTLNLGGSPSWYRAIEQEADARGLTDLPRRTVGTNVH